MRTRMRAAYLFLAVSLVLSGPAAAQAPDVQDSLALAPDIRAGELPNGLRYFIRPNGEPEGRLALRLVVEAGSVDEDDDQRGLAHLLEHMAFNGTDRFAPGELVAYFESMGTRFGPHANAYTSFDETVYMLDVPVTRDGVVERAFEALSDFAGGMTLDPAEIDRERGVVIEEWRGRQGAGNRLQEQQLPAIFAGSRYVDRLPIGLPEVLASFPPGRLVDFYREHYRADRMAVVAVGDMDAGVLAALVEEYFGPLEGTPGAPVETYEVPIHAGTLVVTAADPEAQGASVSIMFKQPEAVTRTVGDYRTSLVESLVSRVLNTRFGEIAQQPDAPFLRAAAGGQDVAGGVEAYTLTAVVEADGLVAGLQALATEVARLDQHPIGEAELDRARRALMTAYERSFAERDRAENGPLAAELVRHVLEEEPVPGIAAEYAIAEAVLPGITAEEVTLAARARITEAGRVVLATAPGAADVPPVDEAALLAAWRAGEASEVAAWDEGTEAATLLAEQPSAGTVTARRDLPELGVTVITLSNGVEVWLKPTDFRNDQVVFRGYGLGGSSRAAEDGFRDAQFAASLVQMAGVGGFSPVDLQRLLAGRTAGVAPEIGTYTQGVSGAAAPRDLELALQLTYLYFTAPNRDPAAFARLTRQLEATLANRDESPGAVFGERVQQVNTSGHYTAEAMELADVAELSADRMLAFYEARFANAADFTFFFVGAFDTETLVPLLADYLGALPSTGEATAEAGTRGLAFPDEVVRELVRAGREPQSQTAISFFADTGLDEVEMHRLRAATTVLQTRLRDILREELGGTYSVGAGYVNTQPEPGYGRTVVQFGSAPDRADALTAAVLAEVERLKAEGPTEADIERVRETEIRELEEAERDNRYWMGSLEVVHLLGWDPARILDRVGRARSLSVENVHAMFERHFPLDRYTVVTLLPAAE
jgi:zinc protease